MKRRNFVNFFLGGSLIGTLATLLYPVIRFLVPPKQSGIGVESVTAAKMGQLAPNTSKIFRFGAVPGILINTSDGELKAFEATCTHLTCTVVFETDTQTLLCPCHNGRFDLNGNVVSGPPPAPLATLEVKISGEDILVSKKS